MNRRQWISDAARWSMLGALAGFGVLMGVRTLRRDDCINDHLCRGCRLKQGCGLPQAINHRQQQQRRVQA